MAKKSKSFTDLLGSVVEKSMGDSIGYGFHDPSIWVDTGNYALNKIISGDFKKGFPMGKTMILAGEPSSGKSYLCCSIIRNAQNQGIFPIVLDSESALDTAFLENIGVDTSLDKMRKFDVVTVAQCQAIISSILKQVDATPVEERQPILFVVDSLGMLLTEKESTEFEKGAFKADMGTKAKQLRLFFRMVTNAISKYDAGLIATNHTYKGSDMYGNSTTNISGGDGLIYAASIVLMLKKKEMKESSMAPTDGIYVKTKCMKTRFAQPFQNVDMELPYNSGLNAYSGLFKQFQDAGLIEGKGWYTVPSINEKFQGEKNFSAEIADKMLATNPDVISQVDDDDDDEGDGISVKPSQLLEE